MSDIPLRPMLDALRENAIRAASGSRSIDVDCPADLRMRGNHAQLESIFGNLLANAVNYSEDGGHIQVRVALQPDHLLFTVSDDGIGIDPMHIPRLTERFYRVEQSRSLDRGGSGLGLAIVKHAMRFYNASLEIDSEPGKGSTFRCRFPLRPRG